MEEGRVIEFDRAKYGAGGASAAPCAQCKQPLEGQYWKIRAHAVCGGCRDQVSALLARSSSAQSFGKAALQGGAVAFGCGIAYAIFSAVTHMQLALVTIGIAFVVARVVRKASGGIGGRRFQVLAVALTYFASTMGYVPGVIKGLQQGAEKAPHAQTATQGADGTATAPVPERPEPPKYNPFVGLAMALGIVLAITLAAPFLELTDAPLGLLIVLFGLWEAWKLSRAAPLVIEGPFRIASGSLPQPGP